MNFYIADTHFGHNSVLNFDHRPFRDIAEMDRVLIENWNARVAERDNVYVVGEFAYKNEKPTEWYLTRLKGKKHLERVHIKKIASKIIAKEMTAE